MTTSGNRHIKRRAKALTKALKEKPQGVDVRWALRNDMSQSRPSPWIIEPKLWSRWDNIRSQTEGWSLMRSGDIVTCHVIDRKDNHPRGYRFATDPEAEAFVLKRADDGSKFHNRALVARTKARLAGDGDGERNGGFVRAFFTGDFK